MIDEDSLQKLQKRNGEILPQLDERQRRLFAEAEARAAGHGGIAAVSRVTRTPDEAYFDPTPCLGRRLEFSAAGCWIRLRSGYALPSSHLTPGPL